jgi:glycosyltransferase involved in cell wall biosynthesis
MTLDTAALTSSSASERADQVDRVAPSPATRRPGEQTVHLAMVAWMVAGIRTHYQNVRPVAAAAADIALTTIEVNPWHEGGAIERLPVLPGRLKSSLRTYASTTPLYTAHRIDVVWSQLFTPLVPWVLTRGATRHVPVVYDADSTPRQMASFGEYYASVVAGPALKRRVLESLQNVASRRAARIVCWSEWAARSYVDDYAVPRERIAIIPPGVDCAAWAPPDDVARPADGPVRLLFVGGDFIRKGGDLLLDVWRRHFTHVCELHLVTRDAVAPEPGVHVYGDFSPNDPGLRRLYHTCHALVLPTVADCFSLASIEAMAAGLPVITTAVGGIPEIVEEGITGYLIPPGDGAALRAAIASLLDDPARRARMGAAGQAAVAARFDATRNANQLLDLLRAVAVR